MRIKTVIINSFLIIIVGCNSCPEDYNDEWKFKGKENVGVDSIICQDTIAGNDSLRLFILGKKINGSRFDNAELDIQRDSLTVLISLYADIYEYLGCGIIPPTALHPDFDTILLPPFKLGNHKLIVNQPSGFETVGTFIVQP